MRSKEGRSRLLSSRLLNRRDFVRAGGAAVAGGLLLPTLLTRSALGGSGTATLTGRSQLNSVLCAALRDYLANPAAYSGLYTTYLKVAPKFIPTCSEGGWVDVLPGTLLASVLTSGVLRFGYGESPPYIYHGDNGELAGLDWELGNALTAIIRQHYAGYAPGTGLRAEWIEVTVPAGTDAEADQFNALYAGLTSGLFDAGMSGQANLSAAAATMPATLQVDWTCPTELLFTNILYSGLGNFNAQLAPLVGSTRDAFIAEIQGWTTTALFGCVVNGGPSQSNAEALVAAIGGGAQLITTTEQDLEAAVANQTIHFSVGDAVLSSYGAIQPGFPGLNMNIAASTDPVGTAQQVAAFTLRTQAGQS